jgi:hypothetical protein
MTTLAIIAQLRELEAKATGGPWMLDDTGWPGVYACAGPICSRQSGMAWSDMKFIAAARNSLSALLTLAEASMALNEAWAESYNGTPALVRPVLVAYTAVLAALEKGTP